MVKAADILDIKTGKYDANHAKKNGKYKFFTCALEPFNADTYAFDGTMIILPGNGANVGQVLFHKGKCEAYQRTYVLHNITEHPRYIYYFFKKNWIRRITKRQVGSATNYIKMDDIAGYKIPLPPLAQQKKIAAILDAADAYRQKTKALIEKYDELSQSLFLDMFGDPVTNPKGWEIVKFSDVGKLDRGKSKHRPRNAPELLGGKHPLIQTGDLANCGIYLDKYNSTYSDIGLAQSKKWPTGTLCITIAANIAKTGILSFDSCFPDSVVGFVPNEKTNTIFTLFWISFLQKILEETAPESAQKNINLSILRNLDLPLPPIEKQTEFARLVEQIELQRKHAKNSILKSNNLFNCLLQKAFKGELTN